MIDKEDLNYMMLDLLGEAICKTTGIDRQKHKQYTDKQTDEMEKLENEVFHFGFFSDLVAGDTKAEGKALMNSMIPEKVFVEHQVTPLQLRLTPYIFYQAILNLTSKRIDQAIKDKRFGITPEVKKKADEIAKRVEDLISTNIDALGHESRQKRSEQKYKKERGDF